MYKVLAIEAPLLQADIRDRTRLSKRTTRHAISLLKEDGLVEERVYIPDARKADVSTDTGCRDEW